MAQKDFTKKMFIVANYWEHDDEFDITLQAWEPSSDGDSFVIDSFEVSHTTEYTREQLVVKQVAQLDAAEAKIREKFNYELLRIKETKEKLAAISFDGESVIDIVS